MLESSNIKRLPATGTGGAAAYVITNPASKLWANLKALTDLGALVLPMGVPGNQGGGRRYRGARLRFFGTGADDSTFAVRIYSAQFIESSGDSPGVYLQLLGTLTVTLSTAVGGTGLALADTERFADALSWSQDADYTAELTAQGSASPTVTAVSETPATFRMPDVGGAGALVFDIDFTGATGGGVLGERIT